MGKLKDIYPADANGVWNGYAEIYGFVGTLILRGNYKNGTGIGYIEYPGDYDGSAITFYLR